MTAASTDADPRVSARGRPRDAARHARILAAAAELLSEIGYDRLSIEAVAARAGVAKTTVYRRWRDKTDLIAAVVERRPEPAPTAAPAADVRAALLDVTTRLAARMADQDLGLLSALLAARRSDPSLAAALQPVLARDEAGMSEPLRQAAARSGEQLEPDFGSVIAELAPALLLHEILLFGTAPDAAHLKRIVDRILIPLIVHA